MLHRMVPGAKPLEAARLGNPRGRNQNSNRHPDPASAPCTPEPSTGGSGKNQSVWKAHRDGRDIRPK
jgi:hypothetical protein